LSDPSSYRKTWDIDTCLVRRNSSVKPAGCAGIHASKHIGGPEAPKLSIPRIPVEFVGKFVPWWENSSRLLRVMRILGHLAYATGVSHSGRAPDARTDRSLPPEKIMRRQYQRQPAAGRARSLLRPDAMRRASRRCLLQHPNRSCSKPEARATRDVASQQQGKTLTWWSRRRDRSSAHQLTTESDQPFDMREDLHDRP